MKNLILLLSFLSICVPVFSQNTCVDNDSIPPTTGTVPETVKPHTYKTYNPKDSIDAPAPKDISSFGLGFGMDYGGIGGSVLVYPQKNIGIFAAGGYAMIGFGYNVGVKLRTTKGNSNFFVLGMHGYNAAIKVEGASQWDKFFYGNTIGLGVDLRSHNPKRKGYFTLALLIPFRSSKVDDYIDDLKNNFNVEFKNGLPPVTISIGYRIKIQ